MEDLGSTSHSSKQHHQRHSPPANVIRHGGPEEIDMKQGTAMAQIETALAEKVVALEEQLDQHRWGE
jgi:hypothetical protein